MFSQYDFAAAQDIETYEDLEEKAGKELLRMMETMCRKLREVLTVSGDWKVYLFAVHDLIAQGRVEKSMAGQSQGSGIGPGDSQEDSPPCQRGSHQTRLR